MMMDPPQNRTPFAVVYRYRINLNISETFPSIGAAIDALENTTLVTAGNLVEEGFDPLFLVVDLNTQVQALCPPEYSHICSLAESTAMISLRINVNERLVEYAALDELQSVMRNFNVDHDNVTVTFVGPFVVRMDISIVLEGVSGKMTRLEVEIFEMTFLNTFGPPLLNDDPSVVLRSASVFLQQLMHEGRRLQEGNESVVVSFQVTGQCNECSDNDFSRVMGEAIDIRRPDFERNLQDSGRENGTGFFYGALTRIATRKEAPGTSDCCLDWYPPPDPFPYWIFIVTSVCMITFTTAACFAIYRQKFEEDKRQRDKRTKRILAQTRTEDASEDLPSTSCHGRKPNQNRRASSLTF